VLSEVVSGSINILLLIEHDGGGFWCSDLEAKSYNLLISFGLPAEAHS